jgi:hypothetical protein
MIQLTSIETLAKAITKARTVKPLVRYIAFRHYSVTNKQTGATYQVTFDKQGPRRMAACDCHAGARGQACYHVAAAVGHHILQAAEIAELGL